MNVWPTDCETWAIALPTLCCTAARVSVSRLSIEQVEVAVAIDAACFDHPWSQDAYDAALLDALDFDGCVAVARDSTGHPLGVCVAVVDDRVLRIARLAVVQSQRRKGVASELVWYVLEHASALGIGRARVVTHRSNDVARQLYARLGFLLERDQPTNVNSR